MSDRLSAAPDNPRLHANIDAGLRDALQHWFPAGTEQSTIQAHVNGALQWLEEVREHDHVVEFRTIARVRTWMEENPRHNDYMRVMLEDRAEAVTIPPSDGGENFHYSLGLMPWWYRSGNEPYRTTQIIHEGFHGGAGLTHGGVLNAFSLQGFVSDLTGVPHRVDAFARGTP